MIFLQVIGLISYITIVIAGAAPKTNDSPLGVVYEADFPSKRGVSTVKGFLRFYSVNGYVRYVINVRNLPQPGGPFSYHIHQRPVPPNNDCSEGLAYFNPYHGVPKASNDALYMVGDLAGKHGLIYGTSYRNTIEDDFMSLNPRNLAFVGDLSVIIESSDGTRVACANLKKEVSIMSKREDQDLETDDEEGGLDHHCEEASRIEELVT